MTALFFAPQVLRAVLALGACVLLASNPASAAAPKDPAMVALPAPEPTLDKARFNQSAGGALFGAMVLATKSDNPTENWVEGKIGRIDEARVLTVGEKARVMVLLAVGATEGIRGNQALSYAIDVYRPDGMLQERFASNVCLTAERKVDSGALVVCDSALTFELEPSDPRGRWVFKVIMPQQNAEALVFGTSFEAY